MMTLRDNALLQGGKYRIVRFIASGGFGCTYEAEHVMLGKRIAIKEFFVKDFCDRDGLTSHVTVNTQNKRPLVAKMKRKFIEEARAISGMSHHGIVKVSDVFEENGTAYFVMDYINGDSLSAILNKKSSPLPEAKAVKYIRQVSEALAYVHKQNRLHLDIKPGNIIIDSNDNAILIDFGNSKQYEEESGENTSTLSAHTPGYAPLEQIGNSIRRFSEAADIYALGATLYKMVTGITPPESTYIASGEMTLAPIPEKISPMVRNAVTEAMRLQKSQRPQSVSEFLKLLVGNDDTVIDEPPMPATPPKKKAKWLVPLIAILGVVMGGVIAFAFMSLYSGNSTKKEYVIYKEFTNANNKEFKFTGELVDDALPTGFGVGYYKDGVYTGEFVNGVRQGNGEFRQNVGQIFNGVFENDQYSEGTLNFDENSYYKGTFKDDKPYNGDYFENNKKIATYINGRIKWL